MLALLGRLDEAWSFSAGGLEAIGNHPNSFFRQLSWPLKLKEPKEGRGVAFRLGREIIDGLLDQHRPWLPQQAMEGFFIGVLEDKISHDLVRDLLDHAGGVADRSVEPIFRAIEVVVDFLDADRDEAVLQRADPDIATTARRIAEAL